jgi:hypothetical protein
MSNVVSLQCARERAWQPSGGSNGHAFKGLAQSVWKSQTTEREAENAQLRENVVELALQIQELHDRARTLTA